MHLYILTCGLEPTAIAEAHTRRAFVDILDNDVIQPLVRLKVRHEYLVRTGIFFLLIGHLEGIDLSDQKAD